MDSLAITTPYMLRNDGALLECGNIHPYVLMSVKSSLETNVKTLNDHPTFLNWFYDNTLQERVKELIEEYKETNNTDLLEELNTLTNNEFCRVRTSNYKISYGGDNGQIYFRISSNNEFNWFDLIYNVVLEYENIDYITIVKDAQAFKDIKDFAYYKIKGVEINQLPVEEFLTIQGNPILENMDNNLLYEVRRGQTSLKLVMVEGAENEEKLLNDSYISVKNALKEYNSSNLLIEEVIMDNNSQNKVKSNGIYSVLNSKWIKEPIQSDIPDIDQEKFEKLFKGWEDAYFDLLKNLSNEAGDSENLGETITMKDPLDKRKKVKVPAAIEEVINSAEFKKIIYDDAVELIEKYYYDDESLDNILLDDLWPQYQDDVIFYTEALEKIGRGNITNIHFGKPQIYNKFDKLLYIAGSCDFKSQDAEMSSARRAYIQIYNDNTFEWLGEFESYSGEKEEFEKITVNMFNEYDIYFDLDEVETTLIEEVSDTPNSEKINDFIEDLYDLRKESIANEGEYGLGNLVFKEFRNLGYLDNLKELKNEEKSKELSLGGTL